MPRPSQDDESIKDLIQTLLQGHGEVRISAPCSKTWTVVILENSKGLSPAFIHNTTKKGDTVPHLMVVYELGALPPYPVIPELRKTARNLLKQSENV